MLLSEIVSVIVISAVVAAGLYIVLWTRKQERNEKES